MSKHNIFEFKDRDTITDTLTEMLRTGSQQLIHQAGGLSAISTRSNLLHRLDLENQIILALEKDPGLVGEPYYPVFR